MIINRGIQYVATITVSLKKSKAGKEKALALVADRLKGKISRAQSITANAGSKKEHAGKTKCCRAICRIADIPKTNKEDCNR